jgi:peptide/nickel transport system ATP-binding protein
MYAGEIVERAPADALFEAPEHPYTVGLLASIPRLDERTDRLAAIDGVLPDMTAPPVGCRFADRCPFVLEECRAAPPPVVDLGGRWSRCLRAPLERLVQ